MFDIKYFYPLITEDLFAPFIFAERNTNVSTNDCEIIFHARKSLLYKKVETWVKIKSVKFDVTMGTSSLNLFTKKALKQILKIFDQSPYYL